MFRLILRRLIGVVLGALFLLGAAWLARQVRPDGYLNPGIAFGLVLPPPLLLTLVPLFLLWLFWLSWQQKGRGVWGFQLILSGGLANLGERMIFGGVYDFFSLPLIPAFNLADLAISLGCFWLLVVLFYDRSQSSS